MKSKLTLVELEEEADLFLKAGRRYFEYRRKAGMSGAVVFVKDTEGFGVIFTRGEYLDMLLTNIQRLGPTTYFGAMNDEI